MAERDANLALDPADGLRVRRHEVPGQRVGVEAFLRVGGVPVPFLGAQETFVVLKAWDGPGLAEVGRCTRLQILMEAVVRYLNTGGDWQELGDVLKVLHDAFPVRPADNGYTFLSTDVTLVDYDEETDRPTIGYEHYFLRAGTQEGVLWVEDQFIEPRSFTDYLSLFGDDAMTDDAVVVSLTGDDQHVRARQALRAPQAEPDPQAEGQGGQEAAPGEHQPAETVDTVPGDRPQDAPPPG